MAFWRHDSLPSIENPRGLMQNTYLATKSLTAAKSKQTWLRSCKVKVILGQPIDGDCGIVCHSVELNILKGKKTKTTTTTTTTKETTKKKCYFSLD